MGLATRVRVTVPRFLEAIIPALTVYGNPSVSNHVTLPTLWGGGMGRPSKVALSPKADSPFTCRGPSRGYGRARSHDPTVVSTSPPGVISQAGGAARRPTRPPGRKRPPQPGDVWVPSPPPPPSGLEGPSKEGD